MTYSFSLARLAFNDGIEKLNPVLADASHADPVRKAAGQHLLELVVIELDGLLHETIRQGVVKRVTPMPPTADEMRYLAIARPDEFWRHGIVITNAVHEIRRLLPGIRADDAPPAVESAPLPPPAPQEINITLKMPEETRTTIVAMPDRITTSTVKREPITGNITETTQIERDAA